MINMLTLSVVDLFGLSIGQVKPKAIKLVFVASPLRSIKEKEQRMIGSKSG